MIEFARPAIHIAAALIDDEAGRLLLVRKAGTRWFMQAGGKIERGEGALPALLRELSEEIGLTVPDAEVRRLGRFLAPAANEPDMTVDAEIFHIRTRHDPVLRREIEEVVWARAVSDPVASSARR